MHTAPSREAAGAAPASTPAPTGLRERNRLRRTRRVERAALELALEHGLDATTVDSICDASDISARTFFNYFGSKESALLGAPPAPLTDAQVEVFLAGDGTVLEDLMTLLATTFLANEPDMEIWRMRRELFAREPVLHAAQLTRVADKKERVAATVAARLRAADPALSEEAALREGHLTHGIAMSAFQQLGREWTAADVASPDIAALVDDAISRVRRIVCPGA
ncbi:TetR/AcrR family transcriptional regulator [Demequina lignilytica]|uniref:TetR family transcriptional regulator n=1 Tax=Demequina lignilytica TaxID=3051663 RepID=A0AB35MIW7_9MICO|nr:MULTISPECIES: TetR/AcrR family transcriptional regulator [unclassified Demequina]MDN4483729.1 TetR family transcriptional regulator [Demequina sp. SYSU T0a273]MDN4491128.1 TetR family transcriptional regulator [Demequina sp. SYSU T00068]